MFIATDKQTNEQTKKQTDSVNPMSTSLRRGVKSNLRTYICMDMSKLFLQVCTDVHVQVCMSAETVEDAASMQRPLR